MKRSLPKTGDLFARLQKIKRLFRCYPCKYQFVVIQHVVVEDNDPVICPKCRRPV